MIMTDSKEAVIKFSGNPSKGLTFEEFGRKALSWARKQYGNAYAKPLWENTLPDINNLDLSEDLDHFVFEEHCEFVYDALSHESAKHADTLIPCTQVLSFGHSSGSWKTDSDSTKRCSVIFCGPPNTYHLRTASPYPVVQGVAEERQCRTHMNGVHFPYPTQCQCSIDVSIVVYMRSLYGRTTRFQREP